LRDIKEKIEELDERVKAYSEEAEDDTVHLKVSNFLPDEQEIREIIDNLEDGTRYLPLHRGVVVVVECEDAGTGDLDTFRESVKKELIPRLYYLDRDMKRLTRIGLIMLAIGAVIMGVSTFLATMTFTASYVIDQILVITSWVFIWTSVEKIFFERRDVMYHKRLIQRLYFAIYSNPQRGSERSTLRD